MDKVSSHFPKGSFVLFWEAEEEERRGPFPPLQSNMFSFSLFPLFLLLRRRKIPESNYVEIHPPASINAPAVARAESSRAESVGRVCRWPLSPSSSPLLAAARKIIGTRMKDKWGSDGGREKMCTGAAKGRGFAKSSIIVERV